MDRSDRCLLGELISAALLALLVAGCKPTPEVVVPILKQKVAVEEQLNLFNHEAIGRAVKGNPWVAHIDAVDLDQDGLLDVIGCEAREGKNFGVLGKVYLQLYCCSSGYRRNAAFCSDDRGRSQESVWVAGHVHYYWGGFHTIFCDLFFGNQGTDKSSKNKCQVFR